MIYKDLYHAPKPEGIENKKAFIVGGGLAGISAAAFLIRDASMPVITSPSTMHTPMSVQPGWYRTKKATCAAANASLSRPCSACGICAANAVP